MVLFSALSVYLFNESLLFIYFTVYIKVNSIWILVNKLIVKKINFSSVDFFVNRWVKIGPQPPPLKLYPKHGFFLACVVWVFWLFGWQQACSRGIFVAQRGFSFINSFRVFLIKNIKYAITSVSFIKILQTIDFTL